MDGSDFLRVIVIAAAIVLSFYFDYRKKYKRGKVQAPDIEPTTPISDLDEIRRMLDNAWQQTAAAPVPEAASSQEWIPVDEAPLNYDEQAKTFDSFLGTIFDVEQTTRDDGESYDAIHHAELDSDAMAPALSSATAAQQKPRIDLRKAIIYQTILENKYI